MSDSPWTFVEALLRMFYIALPSRTTFDKLEEVPEYGTLAIPFYLLFPVIEFVILLFQNRTKAPLRINDAVVTYGQGLLLLLCATMAQGLELKIYVWIYNCVHLVDLDVHKTSTWFLFFILVDLMYYFIHRAAHEVNAIWGAHQVHHNSEDFTISTTMRQSLLQPFIGWIFYTPLALAVPPPMFVVHLNLNLLYQCWIHTECIGSLGWLEYILNTPSHHRVHHGRNPQYVDKNYGGTLIIWDRLFGTFAKEEEPCVYGVIPPINTFDTLTIQFGGYISIFKRCHEIPGLVNKFYVLLKGPGWSPGKPRLGLLEDLPEVTADEAVYDPELPTWDKCYVLLHFFVCLLVMFVFLTSSSVPFLFSCSVFAFTFFSIISFGRTFDLRPSTGLELFRLLGLYVFIDSHYRTTLLEGCCGYDCSETVFWPFVLDAARIFALASSIWILRDQLVTSRFWRTISTSQRMKAM